MTSENYRIRIKRNDVEIDVAGDKDFVQTRFDTLISALNVIKDIPIKIPKEKKVKVVKKTEVKERKKRGRKPKILSMNKPPVEIEETKKPEIPPEAVVSLLEKLPEVKEQKKRGRKPKVASGDKLVDAPKEIPIKKIRSDQKGKSFPELISLKNAKKDSDIIVLAGYFLNKTQKKREFRSVDVLEVLKTNNLPEPSNLGYHFRKLTEDKGLLTQGRKQGRYKVSDNGIKWVEYN